MPSAPAPLRFTFRKAERLCGKRAIGALFSSGEHFTLWGIRFVYVLEPQAAAYCPPGKTLPPVQVLFSVPKRKHKRANVRNLLKRRLREAWRLNRHPLLAVLAERGLHLRLAIVYERTKVTEWGGIRRQVADGVAKLVQHVAEHPPA